MKGFRTFFLFLVLSALAIAFSPSVHAQTRVLVGADGGSSWDNQSVGISAVVEVPFLKHYELDLKDTFSPLETHVALGGGRANLTSGTARVWLSKSFGLNGVIDYSLYDVTKVSKRAEYAFGGVTFRRIVLGVPSRISLDYIQQVNNGITPSGLETSHLQGVALTIDGRIGCAGPTCFRIVEQSTAGRVLTQGNPVCDGSYRLPTGTAPCPRATALGGGFSFGLYAEFPRRRQTENDVF